MVTKAPNPFPRTAPKSAIPTPPTFLPPPPHPPPGASEHERKQPRVARAWGDCGFCKVFAVEVAEAFCDGHVSAFAFFGGVPSRILYANTRLAVARILGDGRRERSRMFAGLQSHYLFDDRFGRPGKGNDKGKVEGLVGYVRRNFMVPIPVAASIEELLSLIHISEPTRPY